MDHSSMDNGDGDGGMMGMADMMMTFFTSTKTPLLSEAWTPHSTGQYAATCVFLIALARILSRDYVIGRGGDFIVLFAAGSEEDTAGQGGVGEGTERSSETHISRWVKR